MRRLRWFFNRIMEYVGLHRPSRPEDIPKKLNAQALEKAMREARFLHSSHGVDVKSLAPGEKPDMPKPAGDRDIP